MSVYLHILICIHTCMKHICTYKHINMSAYIHTYKYKYILICIHEYTSKCMHVCLYTYLKINIHIYICVCVHIYAHAHTYTSMHICLSTCIHISTCRYTCISNIFLCTYIHVSYIHRYMHKFINALHTHTDSCMSADIHT